MGDNSQVVPYSGSGPASGFGQQGSGEWVKLADSTVSFSLAALQRLSGAGVEALTYAGCLKLADTFRIGATGQRRMEEAVASLPNYRGFKNVLYFGFGYRSFVHELATTVSGLRLLGLCACIADLHEESISARILSALWTEVGFPDQYKPSLSQFTCLISACAGVVATTTFQDVTRLMLMPTLASKKELTCSSAESIAQVLHALFQVSTGDRHQITVTGGFESAFIATFAEWFLNLSVFVEDSQKFDQPVFKSCESSDNAQLHVIFALSGSNLRKSGMEISGSTFRLKDVNEIIDTSVRDQKTNLQLRIGWNSVLQTMFSDVWGLFMENQEILVRFLGGIARICQAVGENNSEEINSVRQLAGREAENSSVHSIYPEASYGRGLILTFQRLLPEITYSDLFASYTSLANLPMDAALHMVVKAVQDMAALNTKELKTIYEPWSYLPFESIAIITARLGIIMGMTEVDPLLMPNLNGLLLFQKEYKMGIRRLEDDTQLAREIVTQMVTSRFDPWKGVMMLFTGQQAWLHRTTAQSWNGICILRNILLLPTDNRELLVHIHVIQGRIFRDQRAYREILDLHDGQRSQFHSSGRGTLSKAIDHSGLDRKYGFEPTQTYPVEINTIVREESNSSQLSLYYEIKTKSEWIHLLPGEFSYWRMMKAHSSQSVKCFGLSCTTEAANPWYLADGLHVNDRDWSIIRGKGCEPCVWKVGLEDTTARMFVLELLRQKLQPKKYACRVVESSNCLACSLKEAEYMERGDFTNNERTHVLWSPRVSRSSSCESVESLRITEGAKRRRIV